ncbi:MAG: 4Fe-4S binding protein [Chloroflexota bacterium]
MITVNKKYCPQNHPCPTVRVCPTGALQQVSYLAPTVDHEKCIECGRCTASCRVFQET